MIIHTTVLRNGLRVVIAEQFELPVISAGVFIRQGSRNEHSDENGISHFLEHMIFNSQRAIARGKKAVSEILDNGGVLNAFTTKECTSFEGLALKQHSRLLFQALYELVFEPEFPQADVDAERQVILAELKRKFNGTDQMMDFLVQGMYAGTGYGNWILGTETFIQNVNAEQLEERYRSAYVADNVALVVLTSESAGEVIAIIEEIFGDVPSGQPTPVEVSISEQVHLKVLRQRSEQVVICLGGVAPAIREEGSKNFEVGMMAWGGLPSSRLFLNAREKHGLVYAIQSFYNGYVQTGQWGVFSSVSKDKFPQLMDVLGEEIRRYHDEPLTCSEHNRTVSVLKTQLYTKLQQPDYFLRQLGRREIFRESIYPNDMIRQYELSTSLRIQELAQNYVQPLSMSLVVMGDVDTDQVLQTMSELGA